MAALPHGARLPSGALEYRVWGGGENQHDPKKGAGAPLKCSPPPSQGDAHLRSHHPGGAGGAGLALETLEEERNWGGEVRVKFHQGVLGAILGCGVKGGALTTSPRCPGCPGSPSLPGGPCGREEWEGVRGAGGTPGWGGDGDPTTHGRSFGSREAVGALRSRQALERSGEGYLGHMGPPLAPPKKNPGTLLPFLPEDRGGHRCRRCPVGAGRAGFRVPSAGTPPSAPPHPKTLTLAPDFPVAPRGPRWPRGPCGKRQRWLGDPRPIDLGAGTPKPAGEDPPPLPVIPAPDSPWGHARPWAPISPRDPIRERASRTCHGAGPHSIVPPPWGHGPTVGGDHSP